MSVKEEEQQGLVFEEGQTGAAVADGRENDTPINIEDTSESVSDKDSSLEAENGKEEIPAGDNPESPVKEDSDSDKDGPAPSPITDNISETEGIDSSANPAPKKRGRRKKIRIEVIKEASDPIESLKGVNIGSVDVESAEKAAAGLNYPAEEEDDQYSPAEKNGKGKVVPVRKPRVKAGKKGSAKNRKNDKNDTREKLSINELIMMNLQELREFAADLDISMETLISMKKQEIIFAVLKGHTNNGGVIYAHGSLEILPDGYGFLRSSFNSYLPGSDDIYISPSQIRLFNLRTGDTVGGQIRSPKEGERFFAMLRVEQVNFTDPTEAQIRIPFDSLTPLYPEERINMETTAEDNIATRMINLFLSHWKGAERPYRIPAEDRKDNHAAAAGQCHNHQPSGGFCNCSSH